MFSHEVGFVTGKRWKKKEKKQERIRGRKWVPLFTSLCYTFQDDANAPDENLYLKSCDHHMKAGTVLPLRVSNKINPTVW